MLAYYCEWMGLVFGLTGAFLLAAKTKFSKYGWVAFTIANFALIVFALEIDRVRLLLTYLGFLCSSTLGMYRNDFFKFKGWRTGAPE